MTLQPDYNLKQLFNERQAKHYFNSLENEIHYIKIINYYAKYTKDVDFITSDCGIPMDLESENNNLLVKLEFCALMFMLFNVPKGKNFVAKLFCPPAMNVEVSMLYLVYKHFDEVYFYKPTVNPFSKEYYLIAKGYHPVSDDCREKLEETLKNFDQVFNEDLGLFKEYPEIFMSQLVRIQRKLADHYIYNFNRQLYYVDNFEGLSDEQYKIINDSIDERNLDWIDKFKIEEIKKEDLL